MMKRKTVKCEKKKEKDFMTCITRLWLFTDRIKQKMSK